MKNRKAELKNKNFDMNVQRDTKETYVPTDYGKIKVGLKTL